MMIVASMLPDIDAIGFWLGVPYGSTFGHRGFTHSIVFAVLIGIVGLCLGPLSGVKRAVAFAGLFLSTISHGFLDAMTTGGLGVAFFSPFSNERFFFEWRVIQVSPIGVTSFFSEWGVRVLESEIVYVWLPCSLIAAAAVGSRSLLNRAPRKSQ